jgi:S-DNA-T family DNA segregation ATPase FtsK/SpoIIIE
MARDPYRRHVRRMRQQMRKDGNPYGVVIVGPEEPFAFVVISAITRWLFRHRSAFAPFWLTLGAFIAASVAHRHHSGWWVPVMLATIAATALLGFPLPALHRERAGRIIARILARAWDMCGIGRAIERAYAAAVIATLGGWLSAAIANGPLARPLPATAVIATIILGIPWWAHRRRRARVRMERTISAWPELAESAGMPGSRIGSVAVDAWGWTARVILRKGTTPGQAIGKIPEIESALGARPGSLRIFPDENRADAIVLRVVEKDPHANAVPWPGTNATTITRPVGIGVSEGGRPVTVVLLRRHALIGGIAGAGKSGILNVILAVLAACQDVVLWGVDLKGGMELQPWAACLDRLATTPEEANSLFRDAVGELNRRARDLAARGKRVHHPSPAEPALVIIADEYAELPDESHDCADSIARRGRAPAVTLIAATQRPTQTAMGKDTAVRSQMDVRICLRVRERRDVDLILGQGSLNSGWLAHQLSQPGEFLLSDPEHSAPERNRAYLITDDVIARHAAACAISRATLPADWPDMPQTAPESPHSAGRTLARVHGPDGPETALWAALASAGPEGVPVAELLRATGMTRPTLYRHLQAYARAGRAVQVTRGHWRASPRP